MSIRILSAADVQAALPMPDAIAAMRRAFSQVSAGRAVMPLRARLPTAGGLTLVMPAYLPDGGDLAVKVVSVCEGNRARGLPAILGAVLVLDAETGAPRALLDAASLTALRTGAGGGLAADYLARRDAAVVALFGAGVQARAQLQAVLAVRAIQRVWIISRRPETARRLADEIAGWPGGPWAEPAPDTATAVRQADLVITATSAERPVFDGRDLRPGTHVTGVGAHTPTAQEVDAETVRRAAKIVVDARAAAAVEAGDLIVPGAPIYAELGELVNGRKPGRESDAEITFFKSVGIAAQDAAAAGAVLAAAEARGLGTLAAL